MNIKKLEKATKLLKEVKELDKAILEIDAFAMMVANDDLKIKVKIEVPDIKKLEEAEKVAFDEDGSLISNQLSGLIGYTFNWCTPGKKEERKEDTKTLSAEVGNNISLQLLGVLLYEKQFIRAGILKKLETMGVII